MNDTISGDDLRTARRRLGFTSQQEAADYAHVSARTWGDWERHGVHPKEAKRIRDLFFHQPGGLERFGTHELLFEVGRRLGDLERLVTELRPIPPTREESHPTGQDDAENAPTGAADPESSHIVQSRQPSRQVGKRPPRPTPGPTSK